MVDWMVEVSASFKFAPRSYFLAVAIFDKFLVQAFHKGETLLNRDVHRIGVGALTLANRFEDLAPLPSELVSERIAHRALSAEALRAT
mmetsp:Transcript_14751/g.25094  ORF Transcript_14751/g.25094 Transcript_14751/m.25094 type:complete len:88 (+) Transcript_14751:1644-1907(+)